MSATIFLARHASHDELGKVLSGRCEIAINASGRAEAARLADRLNNVRVSTIHTSPRRRARETAQIVAERRGLGVLAADALDEIDFGSWTGLSFAELSGDPVWHQWNIARRTASTPGGDHMLAVTARAVRHIEASAGEAPLLCVSHCDVIRGVVAHYLGLDPNLLLNFNVDPGSLTELALYGDGSGRIVALNERPL